MKNQEITNFFIHFYSLNFIHSTNVIDILKYLFRGKVMQIMYNRNKCRARYKIKKHTCELSLEI